MGWRKQARLWAVAGMLAATAAGAQTAPRIDKIDPPNWWVQMPKPMLLVRGEGLEGATFSVSDAGIRVERSVASGNGHWAQVYLSASPAHAETVTLRVQHGGAHAEASYTFGERKPASAGFAGFNARDVMYLIMTDRFADGDAGNDGLHGTAPLTSDDARQQRALPRGWHGGDLRGVQQHLDYLQDLGATAVWLTPVYQNHEADSYHGYGATDMYAVDEHYGSLADLQALSAALHRRGMKLVLDTVPNHVGPQHPWVKDEPTPDWFHGTAAHHIAGETNFHALIDPHAPESARVGTLDGWFVDLLPDMNTEKPAVAQYLRQNVIWWIEETGADALRIDTFPYVNREFWHDFHAELNELYPHLTEVGEATDPDAVFVSTQAGGVTRGGVDTGLYTPFDYPMYFALRDVFTKGAPMTRLTGVLGEDGLYPHPERLPVFLGNHDQTRFREDAPSEEAMRLATAYVFTTRGMPQWYAGDELAMRGKEDPDNRRDFPGGWTGDAQSAFTAARRTPEQQRMFAWVSTLARVRREHPALACGAEQVLKADRDWLITLRDGSRVADPVCGAPEHERVVVALHRGSAPAELTVPLAGTWAAGCRVSHPLLGEAGAMVSRGDALTVRLAEGTAIFACE